MMLIFVLAIIAFRESYCTLDCYSCVDVRNVSDCHQVTACSADEYCYTDTTGIADQTRFTLGCRAKQSFHRNGSWQVCDVGGLVTAEAIDQYDRLKACFTSAITTTTYSSLSIIGRSASQYVDCSQCCAKNACNKQLCTAGTHAIGTGQCQDDPSYNCAHTSTIFNICGDIHHAKLVCKDFCGLCGITDGQWSSWGSWSKCDVTCGKGIKSRLRRCDNPAPKDGGLQCPNPSIDTEQCLLRDCPIHGGWSHWTPWGSCSTSCGLGLARRDRNCTNPNPGPGGIQCPGDSRDDRACFLRPCAEGRWSSWSTWTTCSASCLGGLSKRRRSCNNPAPSTFGHDCVGNDEEHRLCNTVPCQGTSIATPVRLVNGSSGFEGRLEVYHNGAWGTVCDDSFSNTDAQVVCRMLNAPPWSNPRAYSGAHYGQGSGAIHLDELRCTGSESSILDCSHNAWSTNDCSHSEDAGVSCMSGLTFGPVVNGGWSSWSSWSSCSQNCGVTPMKTRTRTCTRPAPSQFGHSCIGNSKDKDMCDSYICQPFVRLVNGPHMYEGRLEVYHNGEWGTVCDDGFSTSEARVVCKMLKFPTGMAVAYSSAHFGQGSLPILLDDVSCSGSETSLFSCSHRSWGTNNCGHGEDVGVSCVSGMHIRLVGGSSSHRGRVEVSLDGSHWGTVCDDSFDTNNNGAKVVCRMLGYPTTNARYDTSVSAGTGPTFLDNVNCTGLEYSLMSCSHNPWGTENCGHIEDVGVVCA